MSKIVSKVCKGESTKQKDIGVWDFFHIMIWICQNIVTFLQLFLYWKILEDWRACIVTTL